MIGREPEQHALSDGTTIVRRHDGFYTWMPDEKGVSVVISDGIATLSTTDNPPEHLTTLKIVAKASRKTPAGRSEDAKRWATFNAFGDHCAPHLSAPEQIVWTHLFRWCRDGTVTASTRAIASARGLDPKTVTNALSHLRDVGLAWTVWKSSHKGEPSVYGMHLHPEQCREACEKANAERIARRQSKPSSGVTKPR